MSVRNRNPLVVGGKMVRQVCSSDLSAHVFFVGWIVIRLRVEVCKLVKRTTRKNITCAITVGTRSGSQHTKYLSPSKIEVKFM